MPFGLSQRSRNPDVLPGVHPSVRLTGRRLQIKFYILSPFRRRTFGLVLLLGFTFLFAFAGLVRTTTPTSYYSYRYPVSLSSWSSSPCESWPPATDAKEAQGLKQVQLVEREFLNSNNVARALREFPAQEILHAQQEVLFEHEATPEKSLPAPSTLPSTPPSTIQSEPPLAIATPSPASLDLLFPLPNSERTMDNAWRAENQRQLKALTTCLVLGTCLENQDKVVLLNSHHFKPYYYDGPHGAGTGGEAIWARSIMWSLQRLGYTYLYANGLPGAKELYNFFPSLVVAVLMEQDVLHNCFEDLGQCVKSSDNPDGIPVWKMFAFFFWTDQVHPLDARWVFAPEDYAREGRGKNQYVGYSVEPSCTKQAFLPHERRPDQGYVLAKRLSYLGSRVPRQHPQPWEIDFFEAASAETGLTFVMGAAEDEDSSVRNEDLPASLDNRGPMEQTAFIAEIAKSRILIGVGSPSTSPTPYEALCLGVPFINPVMSIDENDPQKRGAWDAQHGGLKFSNPPYVYNVPSHNKTAFIQAVKAALENPIDRYIEDRMTMAATVERLRIILNGDYQKWAAELLAERLSKNQGPVYMM